VLEYHFAKCLSDKEYRKINTELTYWELSIQPKSIRTLEMGADGTERRIKTDAA